MITGTINTSTGEVVQVSTNLDSKDFWGAVKVRWNFRRDNYKIEPGLYATGNPTNQSDVFVSANYKLSFDHLRKNLDGVDAWILVLDTKGINVWCAAGKGTFGTDELVFRIKATKLHEIVAHRRLIVPQLGATGVSAYRVKELTANLEEKTPQPLNAAGFDFGNLKISQTNNDGFNVVFGPVRAEDIKEFIGKGYRSTKAMRKVNFTFLDRLILVPNDLMYGKYKLLAALAVVFILSGISKNLFSIEQAIHYGIPATINVFLAYIAGIALTPLLLPYLPFRMFAFKGLIAGILLSVLLYLTNSFGDRLWGAIAWFLLVPAIVSFLAMNFTGASTYTSLSGVKKEMRVFVPIQIVMATAGIILYSLSSII